MLPVLPLQGRRILLTRAADAAENDAVLFEARGATVDVASLISIGPPPDELELLKAIEAVSTFDWLVFSSRNGAEAYGRRGRRVARRPRIAAIGPATAQAAESLLGRPPDLVPDRFDAEGLADALVRAAAPGSRMLLMQAADARPVLALRLRSAGFDITAVAAYTTILTPPGDLAARARAVDIVVLASASAARSLSDAMGEQAMATLRGKIVACIGDVTANQARRLGLRVDLVPERATMAALVDSLCARMGGMQAAPNA